jgi:probable rRNA maturation factor
MTPEIETTILAKYSLEMSKEFLESVALAAVQYLYDNTQQNSLSVLITDDAAIKKLNKQYRGLDEVTDVLSFSPNFHGHWKGEIDSSLPESDIAFPVFESNFIGDLVLSFPEIRRQSDEFNQTLNNTLAFLLIHGILHLKGYDHSTTEEQKEMQSVELDVMTHLEQSVKIIKQMYNKNTGKH